MLDYEDQIFMDMHSEDGLLIMAQGLGIERLLLNFIKLYCDEGALVLVLNTSSDEEQMIISELSEAGVEPLPKCITTEYSPQDRENLYKQGGVVFVTSRILVVDMLTHKLPIHLVTGVLIYKAHAIIESGQEAFILRLYRQENKEGFIKAFSDNAVAFTRGFCHVSRVMRNLFVRKLYLWPRFHASVMTTLERHKPEVIELQVCLSAHMQNIQRTVLDIVTACVKELKRCNPTLDTDEITVENILSKSFNHIIKFQLQPIWHELSFKTKRIISDLKALSTVLSAITQCDSISFYNLVNSLRSSDKELGNNSGWLLLDSADDLFEYSRSRVFRREEGKGGAAASTTADADSIEHCPKWKSLQEVLNEVDEINSEVADPLNSDVAGKTLIVARDDRTCVQLKNYIEQGADSLLSKLYNRLILSKMSAGTSAAASSKGHRQKSSKESESSKPGTSREYKDVNIDDVLEVEEDEGDKARSSDPHEMTGGTCLSPDLYQLSELIYIHPLSGNSDRTSLQRMLWLVKPRFIVMYDADMKFIRQVEVYKCLHAGTALRVYFIMYQHSVEEQAFLTQLRKEKEAFEYLIKEKGSLVIPEDRDVTGAVRGDPGAGASTRDGGQVAAKVEHKVIVDMREFRSELPSLIHRRGIDIEPVTLEVGDYILTPEICVERKSLSDLIGSLNSGRLYNQALAMTRYYPKPILLIEFDQNKPFDLQQGKYLLSNDISAQDLTSKLTLLTLHFPGLRFLWCSSPYATAELFEDLKMGRPQPDAAVAQKYGASNSGSDERELAMDRYNHIPQDILLTLPGVSPKNYRTIMHQVNSLHDLISVSQEKLAEILSNKSAAEELYKFLHSPANISASSSGGGNPANQGKRARCRYKTNRPLRSKKK